MRRLSIFFVVFAGVVLVNCKDDNDSIPAIDSGENSVVLADFAAGASSVYVNLAAATTTLDANVSTFIQSESDADLTKIQNQWKASREIWEQSEAHLFGPVATEEIDPRIDTWPVNFVDLDSILALPDSKFQSTMENLDKLDESLKGFHPIEYLIFGKNGDKKASEFNDRQAQYLSALADNLKELTKEAADQWTANSSDSYMVEVSKAGNGSTVYTSQIAAFEEIVTAMAGICDEVANGKLLEPYDAKNPLLEESPFAGNSIIDFTNNIKGVRNVYTGSYSVSGKGIDELVKKHNLSLDGEIASKIDAAITSLGNIKVPFGRAITEQPVQVQNAMTAIDDLKTTLEEKLLPFVKQHAN